jgi:neutral ceramidase
MSVRRPAEERLQWARDITANAKPAERMSRPAIYARETLQLAEFPPILPITCEVFAETGLAIKGQSPFAATFIIELANGYGGYLPTPEQHKLGGYETWPARSSFLEIGAEPKIRAGILELLQYLKEMAK